MKTKWSLAITLTVVLIMGILWSRVPPIGDTDSIAVGDDREPSGSRLQSPKQTDLPISYNIAPSQKVLTIRFNPETKQRSWMLCWGLIPYWAKDPKIAYKTINARVKTVDTARSYRQAFKNGAV